MGLIKQITSPEYIPLKYHRVYGITNEIHSHFTISLMQYISKEDREQEKENPLAPIYRTSKAYIKRYDDPTEMEEMTIRDAYNWLKTLPEFEGAIDDLEDD